MKKKCWRTKLLAFDGNGLNPASVSATKKVLDLSMVIIQGEKKEEKYCKYAYEAISRKFNSPYQQSI